MKDRLAAIESDGWELDDGEERHREAPATFAIPSREEREQLRPGAIVKLIFLIATEDPDGETEVNVERMWVVVEGRAERFYRGTLDNFPLCTEGIAVGMEVLFEPRHVIQIWREPAA
jgi:hypothetical protein